MNFQKHAKIQSSKTHYYGKSRPGEVGLVFLKITEFSDEIDDMVEHQSCDHQLHAGAKEEAQKGTEG